MGLQENLICASADGSISLIERWLAEGADINGESKDGRTPLIAATERGPLNTVNFLLKKGADINLESTVGRTALIAAVEGGRLNVVNYLLHKGADVNYRNVRDQTATSAAIANGLVQVFRVLLAGGANVESAQWTDVLFLGILRDDGSLVEAALDNGADPNIHDRYGKTLFEVAAAGEKYATMLVLLKRGASFELHPDLVFRIASKGWRGLLTLLLRNASSESMQNLLDWAWRGAYSGRQLKVMKDLSLHGIHTSELLNVLRLLSQEGEWRNAADIAELLRERGGIRFIYREEETLVEVITEWEDEVYAGEWSFKYPVKAKVNVVKRSSWIEYTDGTSTDRLMSWDWSQNDHPPPTLRSLLNYGLVEVGKDPFVRR